MDSNTMQPLLQALPIDGTMIIDKEDQALVHRLARKLGIKIKTRQNLENGGYTVKRLTRHGS